MAADVSSLVQIMNRTAGTERGAENSAALITRDLLGGSFKNDTQELDLDSKVPAGWQKRLDLKSGIVYIQRCSSPTTSSLSSSDQKHTNQMIPKLQDLNFPPSPTKPLLNLLDEGCLELKLVSKPTLSSSSLSYQSVCTLEKVKSALERAEKEPVKKRSSPSMLTVSSSPSHSSSSSSIKDVVPEEEGEDKLSSAPVAAAGCPSCLLYVLISRNNPKCPKCHALVPLPTLKKPRINLNISI